MLLSRMLARLPAAKVVGVASLPGFKLCFHKVGQDASAKCDIVTSPIPSDCVHGVVYEIFAEDKPLLDAFEGVGNGYETMTVQPFLHRSQRHVETLTYYATHLDPGLLPFDWYRALVLAGAIEQGLPHSYCSHLTKVPARQDPVYLRSLEHWRLVFNWAP